MGGGSTGLAPAGEVTEQTLPYAFNATCSHSSRAACVRHTRIRPVHRCATMPKRCPWSIDRVSQPSNSAKTWVCFGPDRALALKPAPTRLDRYQVDEVVQIRGLPLTGLEPGTQFLRIERDSPFPSGSGPFTGFTQHLLYTHAAERRELLALSAPELGSISVLIPIRKSGAWWALAQDERDQVLRARGSHGPGHLGIGFQYASRIFRKLYHARFAGGGEWDFLTYFEFGPDRTEDFRELLSALRDPSRNPEWTYVERETEVWMTRWP